jgi:hypothetical protein
VEEKRLLSHKAARVANDVYAEDLHKRKTTKGPSPTRSDTLKATASISNTPHNKHTTPTIFQHWRVIPTLNLQHHNPHRSSQTVINLLRLNPDPILLFSSTPVAVEVLAVLGVPVPGLDVLVVMSPELEGVVALRAE